VKFTVENPMISAVVFVAWSATAVHLAYMAGQKSGEHPVLTSKRLVRIYLLSMGILYLLLQGLFRTLGM